MAAGSGQEGYVVGGWCPKFAAKKGLRLLPGKGKGPRRHDAGLLLIEWGTH